jgi:ferredoxin-NADP reductase
VAAGIPRTRAELKVATVERVIHETPQAVTLEMEVPDWPGHRAGQHVEVRLTAEDGYRAQRSYSIANPPEQAGVAITVERLDDGEVSPYLAEAVREGDQLELRGPIGGWFTWDARDGGPLLLVAGGSGLVPLMAMLRHLAAHEAAVDARLLVSARGWHDVLYRDELAGFAGWPHIHVHHTLTRDAPPGWQGFDRRIDADMLRAVGPPPEAEPLIFVCGPTAFVERAADLLVAVGHPPQAIRAERFGPTGG